MSSITGQPLEEASIYFNNTTIGTSTNSKGEFILEFDSDINSPLIISFMGFETEIRYDFSLTENLEIYLNESSDVLNEVVLVSKENWPRELKLKEFRKNYLGESKNGIASKILNEEDIILRYNKKKKQLTAQAKSPIFIENNNLKYLIKTDLQHFEVNYSYVSMNRKLLNVKYVYYLGNNFYKTLQVNPTKSTIKKRKDTYLGSPLHFMRAMASEDLEREKYKIFKGSYPVKPKKYITVTPIDNMNNVKIEIKDKLNILFQGDKQSYLKSSAPEFYIDKFGNHSPPDAVRFGGDLGRQRMGDTLPLDFLLKNKSVKNN